LRRQVSTSYTTSASATAAMWPSSRFAASTTGSSSCCRNLAAANWCWFSPRSVTGGRPTAATHTGWGQTDNVLQNSALLPRYSAWNPDEPEQGGSSRGGNLPIGDARCIRPFGRGHPVGIGHLGVARARWYACSVEPVQAFSSVATERIGHSHPARFPT